MTQTSKRLDGQDRERYLEAILEFEGITDALDGLVKRLHETFDLSEREEMLELRRKAERAYRRYQLAHATTGSEVDKALWWFSENGDGADESLLLGSRIGGDHEALRNMTLGDIRRRHRRVPVSQWSFNSYWSGGTVAPLSLIILSVLLTAAVFGIHHVFTPVALYLCLTLLVGVGASVLLLRRATDEGQPLITRVCFGVAGSLLLTEVASAYRQAVLVVGRIHR